MTVYEFTKDQIIELQPTSFGVEGIHERQDLQRLLREHIDIVASVPKLLVIAEEFGHWQESKRRMDLLGLDENANLVVIELKRTDDGGHMELQALRYAAMVSTMTFDQVVDAHSHFRKAISGYDARSEILKFLGWAEPAEESFGQAVRIILVDADFSKEITTSVLWLNKQGLDVRCVRLRPLRLLTHVLVDVQQIIPLPEAADFQERVRNKEQKVQAASMGRRDYTRYDVTVGDSTYSRQPKRRAIFLIVKHLCLGGIRPEEIGAVLPRGMSIWRSAENVEDSVAFVEAMNDQGSFDPTRWYCDPNDLIQLESSTYSFTNQWGTGTTESMELLIESFPHSAVSYRPSD